jgi:iron complex transport system ATP-binding protein
MQEPVLNFPFLVEEVVRLGRTPFGRRASAYDEAIVSRVLQLVDACHLMGRRFDRLSGGERQRIQIARTLAQAWGCPTERAASYLLLDEPVASLDYGHCDRILGEIRSMCRSRQTAVMVVLHDLVLAMRYADRLMLMHDGEVVYCASPSRVVTANTLEQYFGVRAEFATTSDGHRIPLLLGAAHDLCNMPETVDRSHQSQTAL